MNEPTISLLPTKTQIETDLDAKNEAILEVAEATHHLATTIRNANDRFWELPTERLLAVLNADVPMTLATFAANTALGTAVNASLDALKLPQFPNRAPVVPGRADILFNGSEFFLKIADPEPTEQPAPAPTDDATPQ